MTSVIIALLLTVWALTVQGSAGSLSTVMANYMTIYNGYYDNKAQFQADNKSQDFIQIWVVPVRTPAIPGKTVLYGEYDYNGNVVLQQIADPYEGINGTFRMAIYNFTDNNQNKRGMDKVGDLSNLKPGDLQRRPPKCESFFEPAGPGMLIGTWPYCSQYFNENPTIYTGFVSCKSIEVIPPRSVPGSKPAVPVNAVRKGDRYKVPGIPDGFVSPCS